MMIPHRPGVHPGKDGPLGASYDLGPSVGGAYDSEYEDVTRLGRLGKSEPVSSPRATAMLSHAVLVYGASPDIDWDQWNGPEAKHNRQKEQNRARTHEKMTSGGIA